MDVIEIFDRRLRRLRRDRAAPDFAEHDFLFDYMVEGIMDRLTLVSRSFASALDLGCHDGRMGRRLEAQGISVLSADPGFRFASMCHGIQCDEDALPFADGSFDLVVSAGVLDQVNDLPGALSLIRRALRPDGLFLAAFAGAGSLPALRAATLAADMAAGGAVGSRLHPQIDVRSAGDLLSRAGFALPVADSERLDVRYRNPVRLLADLRGMAAGNVQAGQSSPRYGRERLGNLLGSLAAAADESGAVTESFEIVFMTGWAPSPDQPKPARRGSGTQSLASVLKPRGDQPPG